MEDESRVDRRRCLKAELGWVTIRKSLIKLRRGGGYMYALSLDNGYGEETQKEEIDQTRAYEVDMSPCNNTISWHLCNAIKLSSNRERRGGITRARGRARVTIPNLARRELSCNSKSDYRVAWVGRISTQ